MAHAGRLEHFKALDGLRGASALVIALSHLQIYNHFFDLPLVHHAWLLYDFFFVLSGFVLSHTYAVDLQTAAQGLRFFLRRLGRLWPLHATLLFVMIGLEGAQLIVAGHNIAHTAYSLPKSLASIPANLFLLQALSLHALQTWNAVSWAISVEFYACILFAVLQVALGRRRFPFAACLLSIIGLTTVMWLSRDFLQSDGLAFVGTQELAISNFAFPRCLYGFFFGALAYHVWRSKQHAVRGWMELPALLAGGVFISLAGLTIWSLLAPPLFAAVICVFAANRGPVARLLESPPLLYLGGLAYAIYLTHPLVYSLVAKGAIPLLTRFIHRDMIGQIYYDGHRMSLLMPGSQSIGDLLTAATLTLILLAAAAIHHFVEQPARRYFNRLSEIVSNSQSPRIFSKNSAP